MALEVMRLGLTRCAMVRIPGGWDTHGGNGAVGGQLNDFFGVLDECMSYLSRTPGYAAPFLMDEVAIFAMSELGRTPRFNGAMGRDHWTYTSLLAAGAGVKGNVAFGSTDDEFLANPTDFITGRSSPSGILLGTEHVGATILTMGNAKVNDFLNGVPACTGLLAGGA